MPQAEQRGGDTGGGQRPVSSPEQAPQDPAERDFLEYHGAERDEQESSQQRMSPAQLVTRVAESVAGQRQRRPYGEHHGHGADSTTRPDQAAPPRSAPQAELRPAQPGPP